MCDERSPGFLMYWTEFEAIFGGVPGSDRYLEGRDVVECIFGPVQQWEGGTIGPRSVRAEFKSVRQCYLVCFLVFFGRPQEARTVYDGLLLSEEQRDSVGVAVREQDERAAYWHGCLSDSVLAEIYRAMLHDRRNGERRDAFFASRNRLLVCSEEQPNNGWMFRMGAGDRTFRVEDTIWSAGSGPDIVLMKVRRRRIFSR